jgi:hypothetical protein
MAAPKKKSSRSTTPRRGGKRSAQKAAKRATAALGPVTPAPLPAVVYTREDALRMGYIPQIAGHMRTKAMLEAELAALPSDFIRTKVPPIILRREVEELLAFTADAAVFAARKIDVTPGHFALCKNLYDLLPAERGKGENAVTAAGGFDEIEDSHAEQLRQVIGRLRLLTMLSGLSSDLCSLGDAQGNLRLMDAGHAIVARVTPVLPLYKPPTEARALLDQINERVETMWTLRGQQAGESASSRLSTDRVHRVKRLLLDTLRYVSVAGLYVFADDPTRHDAYALQHVNGWKNRSRRLRASGATATPPNPDGGNGEPG